MWWAWLAYWSDWRILRNTCVKEKKAESSRKGAKKNSVEAHQNRKSRSE
jgi:hypothetical protein